MKCYRRFSSTRVWQKWRFRSPQTILWLIKHWFSASTFVVKIATFAKPENVRRNARTTVKQNIIFDKKVKTNK
ncbi:hypothetical protein AEM51_01880 [Bacteroidetes bacterium UKL13-3]|nr:hypothetical protein AEM51_01880 [Bacteroidetes bacterium UKL13-3]